MDHSSIITVEPGKRGGKPCVRGMRITVGDVLTQLATGLSVSQVVKILPGLTRDDVLACLSFAAEQEEQRRYQPTQEEMDRFYALQAADEAAEAEALEWIEGLVGDVADEPEDKIHEPW